MERTDGICVFGLGQEWGSEEKKDLNRIIFLPVLIRVSA